MTLRRLLASAVLLAALPAAGQSTFPTRLGESGLLDVPDAEALPRGSGRLAGELRYDRLPNAPHQVGPLPLALGIGLGAGLEAAAAMRQGGLPGDPGSSETIFSAALKLAGLEASGLWPALGLDATLDRFNAQGVGALRALASTSDIGRLRFAAFAGVESPTRKLDLGATGGLATSIQIRNDLDGVLEALASPRGPMVGAALRFTSASRAGLSLGVSWLPRDEGFRVSLGVALVHSPRRKAGAAPAPVKKAVVAEPVKPAGPRFTDDRPRFRMRIAAVAPDGETSRRNHYSVPPDTGADPRLAGATPASAADRRDKELLARADELDARLRRLQSAEAALGNRAERLAAERLRAEARERELQIRSAVLDGRERPLRARGPAGPKEGQLAEAEERLRAQESELAGQERAALEQADLAERRERTARAHEQEREAAPVAAGAAADRTSQTEARERSLEARDAWLAALEERLTATRDRLDRVEAGQRLGGERLDLFERRLSTREDRLALVERRGAPAPAAPATAPAAPGAAAITLLVKPPASIVRGGEAGAAGGAAAPGAVDKATTATALAVLGTGGTLRDADRDAILSVAREAARSGDEVLVWARAQNPGLIEEAARRAEEVKAMVLAEGVPPSRVNTRATLRPSGKGIDVVVSALRVAAAEAPSVALQPGETGRRQVRDAVMQVRPDLERCARAELQRRGLSRAEIVLRLSVDAGGKVTSATGAPPFGGVPLDSCLGEAAGAWSFPGGEGGYTTEVPVTVLGEGGAP